MKEKARLAKARAAAFARTSEDRLSVAAGVANPSTTQSLRMAAKPPDVSRTLRKAGAVLIISPDPFTDVPAAALLGASIAMKGREAASIESLAKEAAKAARAIRDLHSIL